MENVRLVVSKDGSDRNSDRCTKVLDMGRSEMAVCRSTISRCVCVCVWVATSNADILVQDIRCATH